MNLFTCLLAQAPANCLAAFGPKLMTELRNHVSLMGAFTAVILLVLLWALYVRKPERRDTNLYARYGLRESAAGHGGVPDSGTGESGGKHYRRRRRRRRAHRPRNPTLAETRGLPPVRSQPSPPPPPVA